MDILKKDKVSIEEMKAYFATQSPFEPNNRRVGHFAKTIGFKFAKQMINRKIVSFYIKDK